MDIRIVGEDIFNIQSDCVIYFVDNAFSDEETMELVTHTGNRIIEVFSKISSLATGEFKVVPAFNLKATYIVLMVLPKELNEINDENFLKSIFENILNAFDKYSFNTMAIDISRLERNYGKKHGEVFKDFLRNSNKDIVVYICK